MNEEKVIKKEEKAGFGAVATYIALTVVWYLVIGMLATLALSKFFEVDVTPDTVVAMATLLFVANNTIASKKG
jgi:hypothetical protein